MSAASKAGLLKRLHADGADTFAKKVKWVAKHIPTITDPQAYVGWLTREERASMATRNPGPAEHSYRAKDHLAIAKEELASVKNESRAKEKAKGLLSALSSAAMANAEANDAHDIPMITKTLALDMQIRKKIVDLVPDQTKNPQAYVGWLTREERTSMATKNPTAREHQRFAEEELAAAEEAASMVKLSADVFEKAEYLLKAFQHSVCAEREAGYAQHALGRKEGAGINYKGMIKAEKEAHALADKAYRQIRPALEAGLSGKAKNPAARAAKKASGHNYVVCDSHGKAIALTTTLAEARKTVPKGGCVEKI